VELAPVDPNVLAATTGYLVADARGRIVGKVEEATIPSGNGALPRLTVRGSLPWRKRRVVLASEIEGVDTTSRVIALNVHRNALRRPSD
jgi:sporulation protein YlmC with PRC-barrel domain